MWTSDFSRLEFMWHVTLRRTHRVSGVVFRDTSYPPVIHAGRVIKAGVRCFSVATFWGTVEFSEWPTMDWLYCHAR